MGPDSGPHWPVQCIAVALARCQIDAGCGSHSSSISPGNEVWLPGLCSASSPSGSSATVETFLRGEGGTRSNAFATLVERLGGPRPEVTATEIRQEKREVAVFFSFSIFID